MRHGVKERDMGRIDVPHIKAPAYKAALRAALIERAQSLGRRRAGFGMDGLRMFIEMSYMKRVIGAGGFALLVLGLFVATSIVDPANVAEAEGRKILDRVLVKASDLSPEQRAIVESKMKADLEQSLREAKEATDLRYISHEEFSFATTGERSIGKFFVVKHKEQGGENADQVWKTRQGEMGPELPGGVRLLRYTDPEGREVTLGVDQDDMPVMKVVRMTGDMIKEGEIDGFPVDAAVSKGAFLKSIGE